MAVCLFAVLGSSLERTQRVPQERAKEGSHIYPVQMEAHLSPMEAAQAWGRGRPRKRAHSVRSGPLSTFFNGDN